MPGINPPCLRMMSACCARPSRPVRHCSALRGHWVALVGLHSSEWLMLLSINLLLLAAGMFLDAISIFLILLPLLVPIAVAMGWDLVWFGVMMTINLAIGQFTPPMAISLMITSRIAGIGMEETFKWVIWLVLAMGAGLTLMIVFPQLALWLPGKLGYL